MATPIEYVFPSGSAAQPPVMYSGAEVLPPPVLPSALYRIMLIICFLLLLIFVVCVCIFVLWGTGAAGNDLMIRRDLDVRGREIEIHNKPAIARERFVPPFFFPPGDNIIIGSMVKNEYASVRADIAIGLRLGSAVISIPGTPGLVMLQAPFVTIFSLPVVSFIGFFSPSDMRAKQNVAPLSPAYCLDLLSMLHPISFEWTEEYKQSIASPNATRPDPHLEGSNFGFIAQDVEQIVPQAVTQTQFVLNGKQINDWRDFDAHELVPLLVGAIQELSQRLTELEYMVTNSSNWK